MNGEKEAETLRLKIEQTTIFSSFCFFFSLVLNSVSVIIDYLFRNAEEDFKQTVNLAKGRRKR